MKSLESVAQDIELMCNEHGWDQLPMIFHVKRSNDEHTIVAFDILEGNLYDNLEFGKVTEGADCVALMTEGWTYSEYVENEIKKAADFMVEHLGSSPDETMREITQMYYQYFPPSQDKNRVECRMVTVISLDEKPAAVMRRNDGSEPVLSEAVDGRVLDALISYITRKYS